MSLVPQGGGTNRAGQHKWRTIYYAIGSTARTIRLCAVLLTLSIASTVPFVIMALAHGWLG